MLKWIGSGSIRYKGKLIKLGDNIPDSFPAVRIEFFKKKGCIGEISTVIPDASFREKALQEENEALKEKVGLLQNPIDTAKNPKANKKVKEQSKSAKPTGKDNGCTDKKSSKPSEKPSEKPSDKSSDKPSDTLCFDGDEKVDDGGKE